MSAITEILERVGDFQLQGDEPRSVRQVRASYRRLVAHPQVPSLTPAGDRPSPIELTGPTRARRWSPYLAVAGLFWALPAGLLLVAFLVLPDSITTIGALTAKDATVVLAIYAYPFFVVAGWLIMAVIAMVRAWRHGARWLTRKVTARRCSTRQLCRPVTTEQITAMFGNQTFHTRRGLPQRGDLTTRPSFVREQRSRSAIPISVRRTHLKLTR